MVAEKPDRLMVQNEIILWDPFEGATGPFGSVAQGESWIPDHVIPVGSTAAAYECYDLQVAVPTP